MQSSHGSKIAFSIAIAAISSLTDTVFGQSPKELTNSIGMKFVLIPKGKFVMGNRNPAVKSVLPQWKVTISREFYLGVHEVTQSQYKDVMGANPSHFQGEHAKDESGNLPVENLRWSDAVEFCLRLSEIPEERKHKRFYRLPTEAEWEYACRADTSTKYFFGDDDAAYGEYAWYVNNSGDKPLDFEALWKKDDVDAIIQSLKNKCRTHPVGTRKPNPWGLFDIYGNVSEWCLVSYDEDDNHLQSDQVYEVVDPINPSQGVSRGNAYSSSSPEEESEERLPWVPEWYSWKIGFRVATYVSSDHVHPKNDTASEGRDVVSGRSRLYANFRFRNFPNLFS
jgi:formylglycine-generating enzyme required for sulfatase activity